MSVPEQATNSTSMNTVPRAELTDEALGRALRSSLDVPLSALRASLESLARELGADPRSADVDQALGQVSRAGRVVSDLAEYASHPVPMPLWCSVDEILYTARHRLSRADRERVSVANSLGRRRLFVDGPLLSRALERLLRNAIEASESPALITARRAGRGEGQALFAVFNEGRGVDLDPDAVVPFHTTKKNHIGLGLTLAVRDVELLGGSLSLVRTPGGEIAATVSLPDTTPRRPAAEM